MIVLEGAGTILCVPLVLGDELTCATLLGGRNWAKIDEKNPPKEENKACTIMLTLAVASPEDDKASSEEPQQTAPNFSARVSAAIHETFVARAALRHTASNSRFSVPASEMFRTRFRTRHIVCFPKIAEFRVVLDRECLRVRIEGLVCFAFHPMSLCPF